MSMFNTRLRDIAVQIGDSAAGANETELISNLDGLTFIPGGAKLTVSSAVTANDTNYATLTIKKNGTSIGAITTQTSGSGGTGDIAARGSATIALTAGTVIDSDDIITVEKTYAGSGHALAGEVKLYDCMAMRS